MRKLIIFNGTVGSGKTTQIILLASRLKHKKVKVKTTVLKTNHIFSYVLTVILAKLIGDNRKNVYPLRKLIEERSEILKKLLKLWLFLDLVSITIRFLITVYAPLKRGHVVLIEEYIPAIIADYIYIIKAIGGDLKKLHFTYLFLRKLIDVAKPISIIYLDAPNNILKKRWRNKGIIEEKPDYIVMQRTLLLKISKSLAQSFLYLNTGSRNITETHKTIWRFVTKGF